jgi:hypothetical protein
MILTIAIADFVDINMKKCKNCREPFTPIRSTLEKYCSKSECIRVFVEEAKSKAWAKTKKEKKAELMTVQDWIKIAQTAFNAYIRERDKGCLCISCGNVPKKENAGHYFSAGGHSNLRFNEDNVHLQCEHCNTFLSGNLLNYQIGIEKRIGGERLLKIHEEAHRERRYTIDELKEITALYKKNLKELKQESK